MEAWKIKVDPHQGDSDPQHCRFPQFFLNNQTDNIDMHTALNSYICVKTEKLSNGSVPLLSVNIFLVPVHFINPIW
jgi:hypothetical protein